VIARFKRDVKNFLTLPDMGLQLERKPAVILIVGVNGSGKTTTIGKLATAMKRNRRKVLLVAADTFRAAAAEQLTIWAERAGVEIVRGNEGADPLPHHDQTIGAQARHRLAHHRAAHPGRGHHLSLGRQF